MCYYIHRAPAGLNHNRPRLRMHRIFRNCGAKVLLFALTAKHFADYFVCSCHNLSLFALRVLCLRPPWRWVCVGIGHRWPSYRPSCSPRSAPCLSICYSCCLLALCPYFIDAISCLLSCPRRLAIHFLLIDNIYSMAVSLDACYIVGAEKWFV